MAERPQRPACDLVMKGGLTSGIVYPPAILELHEKYQFRCIGGASAGAIAAAGTAAAQYGEETGGFEELARVNEELGEEGKLRALLQPDGEARPLFDLALQIQANLVAATPKPWRPIALRGLWTLYRTLKRHRGAASGQGRSEGALVGAAAGAAVGVIACLSVLAGERVSTGVFTGHVGLVGISVGVILGLAMVLIGRWVGGVADTILQIAQPGFAQGLLFGLCPGHRDDPANPAIADWLHARINTMAGLPAGVPLTFGDLRRKDIELRMVTTDLSYGQPSVLPFSQDQAFVFEAAEMEKLFPAEVVEYLKAHGADPRLPPGFYRLPTGPEMPVVVATRMSLSFPVLLAGVPLYRVKGAAAESPGAAGEADVRAIFIADLEKHWFSDGGISSNFPIHFYDSWLPTRPTFGIELTSATDAAAEVTLPSARDDVLPGWTSITDLPAFLWAVANTAIGYRDNMQSVLPSYRERIAQIPLSEGEGGLNIEMGADVIAALKAKGKTAGEKLSGQFDLQQHQWVRFAVLSAHLEDELRDLKDTFTGEQVYSKVFEAQAEVFETRPAAEHWYHPQGKESCFKAETRMKGFLALLSLWEERDRLAAEAESGGTAAASPPVAPAVAADAPGDPAKGPRASLFFKGVTQHSTPDSMLRVTPEL